MGPSMTTEQAERLHGHLYNAIPSFSLGQGVDADGAEATQDVLPNCDGL